MSVPLLMTKFNIPLPGKFVVERPFLIEKLDGCLQPDCRLTLISAPAGFGKTTLVSAWVNVAKAALPDGSVAWLSIDEGDNDPVIFWTYLIEALRAQAGEIGKQTLALLPAPQPALEGKLSALINDLNQVQHSFVLVLDDFHLIRNPLIQHSFAFFIEHIPPQFHILVVSRTDPPLPLALLRGRGQLLELRLKDLRFSDEDAAAYVNAGVGLGLPGASIRALNQKTEGWIVGLQMAVLSLRDVSITSDRASMADFVASFSSSNRYILDYLVEEVLNRQPEPVQNFLARTSILDRLCAPLCDAVLDESNAGRSGGAQAVLEYLESSNLFIIPLDNERYWYRYHHLFTDLLRKRLTQSVPGETPELHRRAAQWYEQQCLIPKAIEHVLLGKDFRKATELVGQIVEAMWARGEHSTLLAWIDALPEEEIRRYPHIWVFQVSMLISAGKYQEAERCIPAIEKYIQASLAASPDQTGLIGDLSALRTYIASFYGNQPELFRNARLALDHLTQEKDAGQRCGVNLVLGNAHLTDGNLVEASQAFMEAVESGRQVHRTYMVLSGMSNLVIVLWQLGRLKHARQVCQEGLLIVEQNGLGHSPMAADLFICWGLVLCERRELAEAEKYIRQGLDLAQEQNYIWPMAWGHQAQARLLLALGDLPGAEMPLHAALQLAQNHEIPTHLACETAGLLAETWIRQGHLDRAERFLTQRGILPDGKIDFPHLPEYLALARLYRAKADLASAFEVLGQVWERAETSQQVRMILTATLSLALLEDSRGNFAQSLSFLDQAAALAEAGEYVQTFIAEGEMALSLLQKTLKHIHRGFLQRLVEAFQADQISALVGAEDTSEVEKTRPARSGTGFPIQPLSRREIEVLQLIAEGYSNKEIAQRLYLSLRTIKYYSTGLYNKLGVDGRMQAVIRAREAGLL